MSCVVLPFPERGILAAYWVVRRPGVQDDMQLALASSVLVEAVRRGERIPKDTLMLLMKLVEGGYGRLEFQESLKRALVEATLAIMAASPITAVKDVPEAADPSSALEPQVPSRSARSRRQP